MPVSDDENRPKNAPLKKLGRNEGVAWPYRGSTALRRTRPSVPAGQPRKRLSRFLSLTQKEDEAQDNSFVLCMPFIDSREPGEKLLVSLLAPRKSSNSSVSPASILRDRYGQRAFESIRRKTVKEQGGNMIASAFVQGEGHRFSNEARFQKLMTIAKKNAPALP